MRLISSWPITQYSPMLRREKRVRSELDGQWANLKEINEWWDPNQGCPKEIDAKEKEMTTERVGQQREAI